MTISASASDNVRVTKVEFYVDGVFLKTDTSAPYSVSWNARKAAKGAHTIKVVAYDAAGNSSSASISVTVR